MAGRVRWWAASSRAESSGKKPPCAEGDHGVSIRDDMPEFNVSLRVGVFFEMTYTIALDPAPSDDVVKRYLREALY